MFLYYLPFIDFYQVTITGLLCMVCMLICAHIVGPYMVEFMTGGNIVLHSTRWLVQRLEWSVKGI